MLVKGGPEMTAEGPVQIGQLLGEEKLIAPPHTHTHMLAHQGESVGKLLIH